MSEYLIEKALVEHKFVTEYTRSNGEEVRYEDHGWYAWQEAPIGEPIQVEGIGTVTVVEFDDEDNRDYQRKLHFVFRIEDEDTDPRFFKKDGFYQSYSGSDWDGDFYEVESVKKMISVWEKA